MDTQQEQLDPSIVALAKAIGHQESGGKYDKIGDNGHSKGAYQWNSKTPLKEGEIPANFRSYAHEVGANTEDFSPANQDRVAYKTIEKWGKQGLTPAQIASKWNSGAPDTYKTAKPGYNKEQGVNYDVKSYVDNVAKYYEQFKGGSNNSTDGYVTSANIPDAPKNQQGNQDIGTFRKVGNALSLGGSEQLGNEIGSSLAILKEKAKGALGGQDNSQYIDAPDAGNAIKGGLKTAGSAALLALGGTNTGRGIVTKLLGNTPALENPLIKNILSTKTNLGELNPLTKETAINRLQNSLKKILVSETGGKKEQLILKALKELTPMEKKSLTSKAGGLILNLVKNLGGTAVGIGIGSKGKSIYDHLIK